MKSYCVKQRKQTECAPGSEQYVKTKNGRNAMKCKCAECGITKFRFVKGSTTGSTTTKTQSKNQEPKQNQELKLNQEQKQLVVDYCLGKNSPFRNIPLVGAIF